jgi:hypothetical protein
LQPAYAKDVPDYAVRCKPGKPVELDVEGEKESVRLKPGQGFSFKVGRSTHHLRCLPADFPRYRVGVAGPRQAEYYLTTPVGNKIGNYTALFDNHGTPVWWFRTDYPPWDGHVLPNGDVAFSKLTVNFGQDPDQAYEQRTIEGELVRRWKTVDTPTDAHEFFMQENGNALMFTYVKREPVDLSPYGGAKRASVYDTEIQEIRPDGTLAWRWNAGNHIDILETERWFKADKIATGWDLHHGNAAVPDADGGILFSSRYADAIYRIDKRTGRIDWKLGGYKTPESLKVSDPGLLGGQHDVRVLEDGTITIFDNANNRGHSPRALRVKVDAEARTAEVVEKIEDRAVTGGSHCCGSARKLPGGNWVIGWGGLFLTTEARPDGKRVFRLEFVDRASYRADPVLPGVLSRERLRAAMDARVPSGR